MPNSGNSIIKPINPIGPMRPLNVEAVDGMAQMGSSRSPRRIKSSSASGSIDRSNEIFKSAFSGGSSATIDANSPVDALIKWGKTQAEDLGSIVKGIPTLAAHIGQSIWNLPKNIEEFYEAVSHSKNGDTWNATKSVLGDLWTGVTQHYRDESGNLTLGSTLRGIRDHTALAALDAVTIASLGAGGTARAAMAARAAGMPNAVVRPLIRATRALRAIESAPAKALSAAGRKFESLPVVRSVERSLGIDPQNREIYGLLGSISARNTSRAIEEAKAAAFNSVPKNRWRDLADIMDYEKPAIKSEWASVPGAWDAIRAWGESNKLHMSNLKELATKAQTGMVGEELFENAQIRKIIIRNRLKAEGLDELLHTDPDALEAIVSKDPKLSKRLNRKITKDDELSRIEELGTTGSSIDDLEALPSPQKLLAMEEYRAAKLQRERNIAIAKEQGIDTADNFYRPWIEEASTDVADIFRELGESPDLGAKRVAGFLKRSGFRPQTELNPTVWSRRAISARTILETQLQWIKEVSSKHGKVIRAGEVIPEGFKELPPIYEKYIDHQLLANSILLKRKLEGGISEGIVNATADIQGLIDKEFAKEVFHQKRVILPENLSRSITMEMERAGGLTKMYDTAMNWWRNATFMSLRFYVNNLIGNAILTVLHGIHPLRRGGRGFVEMPSEVSKMLMSYAERPSVLSESAQNALRWFRDKESRAQSWVDRPFRETVYNRELEKELAKRGELQRVAALVGTNNLDEIKDVLNTAYNSLQDIRGKDLSGGAVKISGFRGKKFEEAKEVIRGGLERQYQEIEIRKRLESLAAPVEKAVSVTEQFLGAYGKLTPFERKVVRRIIPFWTFMKTMFSLAWKLPAIRPKTTVLWHRLTQMAMESFNDENLPSSLSNAVFVGYDGENDRMIFARVGGFNPFEAAAWRSIGGAPVPALIDPRNNPLVSVAHSTMGGYDSFGNMAPLERGQFMDPFGRVWQWDSHQGRAEMVTPQKGFVQALGELVPQVSWLNDFLASKGFRVPGGGPRVYVGPDGKPTNPRHWWYGLGRLVGAPIDSANLDEARRRDILGRYYKLKAAVGQLRSVKDPQEREEARKILYDMMRHPEFKTVR